MLRPAFCSPLGILLVFPATAQTLAPPPPALAPIGEQGYSVTGNISITNQYVFRGLTQTDGKPALQGGMDLVRTDGFYLGTWLSSISWYTDQNAGIASAPVALSSPGSAGTPYLPGRSNSANLEWDFFGGYKRTFGDAWNIDLGLIEYFYPGIYENTGAYRQPDSTEVYGLVCYGWFSIKFSQAIGGHFFGVHESSGANYTDGTLAVPIQNSGYKFIAHLGYQHYPGRANRGYWGTSGGDNSFFSYSDYKAGITKDNGSYTTALAWTYAKTRHAAPDGETTAYMNAFGHNIGRGRLALTITKNF